MEGNTIYCIGWFVDGGSAAGLGLELYFGNVQWEQDERGDGEEE